MIDPGKARFESVDLAGLVNAIPQNCSVTTDKWLAFPEQLYVVRRQDTLGVVVGESPPEGSWVPGFS
jgi:hypothetical protein